MNALLLTALLVLAGEARGEPASRHTPEQLAIGAVREIVSAQAVYRQSFPDAGYACRLEPLVEADILLDTWLAGTRVEGYTFEIWCDGTDTPQTTFRASAVPVEKRPGATLTVCTDETNVVRAIESDVIACFERGQAPGR